MRIYSRYTAILSLCFWCVESYPQTTITVKESGTEEPLPSAHILYYNLASEDTQAVLTNNAGVATVPKEYVARNPRFIIRISYIGFKTLVDTISNKGAYFYALASENQGLNEVVVTAQYAVNSPEKAVHKIRIIDQQKIESMAAVNLEDVLMNETNIRISQDAVLGSSISMQGISGENVKIMIDGVPIIGRQGGNIDLNQINLNQIERIEIVEGPLSVEYGTDALAGTINLITKKKSEDKTKVNISSYNETIGTYNVTASVSQQIRNWQVGLTGGRNFFNGWAKDHPMEPNRKQPVADSSRSISWDPREQYFGRGQVNYHHDNIDLGYRFEYFDEIITNRGIPRAPYNEIAFDDSYNTIRSDNAITALWKAPKNLSFNAVASYNYFERTKNTYVTDLTNLNQQLSSNFEDQDTSRFDQFMIRTNVAYTKDSAKVHWSIGYEINNEHAFGRRIEDGSKTMGNYAVFASAEISILRSLVLRPGIRYSYNTVYDAPITPSFNAKWQNRKWALRASYGRGFRAPGLKELYFNFVDINHNIIGNTDLVAERSNSYTVNLRYKDILKLYILKAEVGGFYNDIRDKIDLAIIDLDAQQFSYVNIGRSQSQGYNADISIVVENLKLNTRFAYIGIRNDLANVRNGGQFEFYPEVASNLTYDWQKPKLNISIFHKYQGRLPRVGLDENDELIIRYIEDYSMMDANVSRKFLDKRLAVAVGVKNVFNVVNVNSNAGAGGVHSAGVTSAAIATGRFYLLKFDFWWAK